MIWLIPLQCKDFMISCMISWFSIWPRAETGLEGFSHRGSVRCPVPYPRKSLPPFCQHPFFVLLTSDDRISRESRMLAPVRPRTQAIRPSETWDTGCRFAVPNAPDCGCFSQPASPRISRYGVFPPFPWAQRKHDSGRWEGTAVRIRTQFKLLW